MSKRLNTHGMVLRDAIDRRMVKESHDNYSCLDLDENSVVLDLGAHVGGFMLVCHLAGVNNYTAYEPNPGNYETLCKNREILGRKGYTLLNSAVSDSSAETLTFYNRRSLNASCAGTLVPGRKIKSMDPIVVDNTQIDDAWAHHPNVLKMDIEGAELPLLEYLDGHFPDHIKQIAIEVHNSTRSRVFEEIYHPSLLQQGFELVYTHANIGFPGSKDEWTILGHTCKDLLWGFDLVYKR